MRTKKLFLVLFIVPFFAFTAHKYYLSLTQIEYNEKNKSVEVIINVFIDDIETALNNIHNRKFVLDTKNEPEDSDKYFKEYLEKNVQFKFDDTPVAFNYLGKEYDVDIVYFYLEVSNVNSLQEIEINNTILIDHFPDQQNLVKSKVRKKHKSVMLTKKEKVGNLKH